MSRISFIRFLRCWGFETKSRMPAQRVPSVLFVTLPVPKEIKHPTRRLVPLKWYLDRTCKKIGHNSTFVASVYSSRSNSDGLLLHRPPSEISMVPLSGLLQLSAGWGGYSTGRKYVGAALKDYFSAFVFNMSHLLQRRAAQTRVFVGSKGIVLEPSPRLKFGVVELSSRVMSGVV